MADPNKQKDIETGVAITQGILGGLGGLADSYFASKQKKLVLLLIWELKFSKYKKMNSFHLIKFLS